MSGFKLLGIIPLRGCSSNFRKNLKVGNKYLFYNNYSIKLDNDSEKIISVIPLENQVPKQLYQLKNGINLNISAVVGENGSGKSTLFELLYYLIYLIASEKKVNNERLLIHKSEDIDNQIEGLNKDFRKEQIQSVIDGDEIGDSIDLITYQLIKQYDLEYITGTTLEGNELRSTILNELKEKKTEYARILNTEKKKEKEIKEELAVSVIFEKNEHLYEVNYSNGNLSYCEFIGEGKKELSKSIEEFDLQQLFYNVSINYSIHALNSNTIGNWVSKLFHKNDAYITPVVINPMRDEGNFDINQELHLAKERLMANVIYDIVNDKNALVIDKYEVVRFNFSVKKNYRNIYPIDFDKSFYNKHIVGKLLNKQLNLSSSQKLIPILGYALAYLEKKIDKIRDQYWFLIYKKDKPNININDDDLLLQYLSIDKSHITKKVRQTVNFIQSIIDNPNFWQFEDGGNSSFEKEKLIEWIKICSSNYDKLSPVELVELALPGLYNVDFEFINTAEEGADKKSIVVLDEMSSGEQQMILNTSSILYHLYNLQSVHLGKGDSNVGVNRVKYDNINLILDEIELYYHPDMQRHLVNDLVNSLEKVKHKMEIGITSINICFITHSPFILSDIPSLNILKLKEGEPEPEKSQTFGANIHELLADSFFMDGNFIGQYAYIEIDRLVNFLTGKANSSRKLRMNKELAWEMIKIIGEPIIKVRLKELYISKFGVEGLEDEIDWKLQAEYYRNEFQKLQSEKS